MLVFVQAINIPLALSDQERLQTVLRNVGRINHVAFHGGNDELHRNAVIHLETSGVFKPLTLTPYDGEQITFDPIPEKFVKTIIGDDLETHINTPYVRQIGTHLWSD